VEDYLRLITFIYQFVSHFLAASPIEVMLQVRQ